MIDWSIFLVALLATLCGVLAWMYIDAEREIRVLQNHLERLQTDALVDRCEIDDLRFQLDIADAREHLRT